jgi:alpha/beta superfamily hydrolase
VNDYLKFNVEYLLRGQDLKLHNTREERVTFHSEGLQIEGLLCKKDGEDGVVITHPHPLYGGNMHNQVVQTMALAYQEEGFSTLRFNFRGVGNSKGSYGEGKGEEEDVKSALNYMYEIGNRNIDLAGYSFGSWVNVKISNISTMVNRIIMVSPPVAFLDFSFLCQNPKIIAIITGERDEIAPVERIRETVNVWNPDAVFKVIEGADHYYTGKIDVLRNVLHDILFVNS